MNKKTTKKEMLIQAALDLFSEKGFDGVGVDEIGDAVGLKGPAIYHYFKGKEALFDGLVETLNEHYNRNFFGDMKMPDSIDEFISVTMKRLDFTIHDPQVKKIRRLHAIEQFRNKKMAVSTSNHHITMLEEMNAVMIEHLIRAGQIKPYDPKLLSFEFTSPITMMIHLIDREPEREAEAMEKIKKHTEHFAEVYKT